MIIYLMAKSIEVTGQINTGLCNILNNKKNLVKWEKSSLFILSLYITSKIF